MIRRWRRRVLRWLARRELRGARARVFGTEEYPPRDELVHALDMLAITCINQETERERRAFNLAMTILHHLDPIES